MRGLGSDSPAGGAAHAAQDAGGRGATGGLSGARAQRERDVPPRLEVWRGARQMQHHAADRADDVDPQLQQPVAQVTWHDGHTRTRRQSQLLAARLRRSARRAAECIAPGFAVGGFALGCASSPTRSRRTRPVLLQQYVRNVSNAWRSSSIVSKLRTHNRFSFSVRMKRSARRCLRVPARSESRCRRRRYPVENRRAARARDSARCARPRRYA